MSGRPRIAVTGPDRGGLAAWWLTALAVWRAGGRPVRVRPRRPRDPSEVDGLVVGGGADVDPARYGGAPRLEDVVRAAEAERKRAGLLRAVVGLLTFALRVLLRRRSGGSTLDPARDELETAYLEHFLSNGRPVLGICRGAQILNVVCGGTLQGDLTTHYVEHDPIRTVFPRKPVELVEGSRLARVLETSSLRVNALHRQAVDEVAPDLEVVGRERSGVPQAVEHRHRRFVLGVQWHPEMLPQVDRHQRLFRALVAEVDAQRSENADCRGACEPSNPSPRLPK